MTLRTIFALSSGSPPAAIAVVRISGPDAHRAGGTLAGNLPPPRQAALRELRDSDGALLDQALVLRFDGPHSATGEDSVELHCHGGRAVVRAVLDALGQIDGVREAEPGEFTRRAFENGRIDLTEAEGLADLIEAETESQRRAALVVAEGGLRHEIDRWRTRLLELSARAEAAIDYVDEESVDADFALSRDCAALAGELGSWLERPRSEPLKDGLRVIIAGPPNSGKSSLLNVLSAEERAIVTDQPGTTRDHIEVPMLLHGVAIRLTDTAGIRDSDETVEQIGIERAQRLMEQADILLWLGDPGQAPAHPHLIQLHPRCDLPGRTPAPDGTLAVSAVTGEGLGPLADAIAAHAREMLPPEGQAALNRRQWDCVSAARDSLDAAAAEEDVVIVAELLRSGRSAFDRLTGQAGVEDLLDSLFARFCLGK